MFLLSCEKDERLCWKKSSAKLKSPSNGMLQLGVCLQYREIKNDQDVYLIDRIMQRREEIHSLHDNLISLEEINRKALLVHILFAALVSRSALRAGCGSDSHKSSRNPLHKASDANLVPKLRTNKISSGW